MQTSLSQSCRDGCLVISFSALLNIYAVLWVFSLYGGDNGSLCLRDTFPHPGPLYH